MRRASRVLVVDDHPLIAESVAALAKRLGFLEIELAASIAAANDAVERHSIDELVAIVDVRLGGESGLDFIRSWAPRGLRALVLTADANAYVIQSGLDAGAKGFVAKTDGSVVVGRALEVVARGESFLSESCRRAIDRGANGGLSKRETEVLRWVGHGLTNKEIAQKLDLAVRTVESHRERLMTKLDAHNAADLTREAMRRGLVERE